MPLTIFFMRKKTQTKTQTPQTFTIRTVSIHAELTFLSKQAASINCILCLTSPSGLYLKIKQKQLA